MKYIYDYPRSNITADVIYKHPTKGILLIKRKNDPDAGKWATPGGHLEMDERLIDCARREFAEEAGFHPLGQFELIGVYDMVDRDPRGRYITFVYGVDWKFGDPEPKAGDDASDVIYLDVDAVATCDLAIDHKEIIMNALSGAYRIFNAMQHKR